LARDGEAPRCPLRLEVGDSVRFKLPTTVERAGILPDDHEDLRREPK
jgi:hypothetical protein